ncbi:hypothetical protein HYG81_21480 (plasmid) [Natrinema zhouii]|uniref:hypothetical protein n=1 Tax=Natrinema zhouii TaxID=1710539 RepID=UPI001CFFE43C|nr:hypothetical protein [Natrinema zhouii]UHQ98149.1 hypothetical protein HYG81_21480 [Natrinema zhouii]
MNKPESVNDVWPHKETVIFLMDSKSCFGESISDLIQVLESCEHIGDQGIHKGNELSATFHHFNREKVGEFGEVVPNSLIFVDFSIVFDTDFEVYLRGNSIPRSTEIVILIQSSDYSNPRQQVKNLTRSIETATCTDDVLKETERYFKRICPECQGDLAKNWVLGWEKKVYQRVHN